MSASTARPAQRPVTSPVPSPQLAAFLLALALPCRVPAPLVRFDYGVEGVTRARGGAPPPEVGRFLLARRFRPCSAPVTGARARHERKNPLRTVVRRGVFWGFRAAPRAAAVPLYCASFDELLLRPPKVWIVFGGVIGDLDPEFPLSKAMDSSTVSRLSAPRSSMNDAFFSVTLVLFDATGASTTTSFLTRSAMSPFMFFPRSLRCRSSAATFGLHSAPSGHSRVKPAISPAKPPCRNPEVRQKSCAAIA